LQQAIAGLKSVSKVVAPLVKRGNAMDPERIGVLIFGGILWSQGTCQERQLCTRKAAPRSDTYNVDPYTGERQVMADQKLIISWLHDAYALENGIAEALEKQVAVAADHPAVQSGIQRHLDATKGHAETVKTCLEQLGESPSGVKTTMATLGAKVHGLTMGAAKDDLVKFALNDYATEHMEIASYKAMIVAAEEIGQTEIAAACQGILNDEIAMAAWLEGQMPALVREAVQQGET
jgi:ferritin-like metal-binding protein YciE